MFDKFKLNSDICILPPSVNLSFKEFQKVIHYYTTEELEKLNVQKKNLTVSEMPYRIIGVTKCKKIAFCGLNYIGTEKPSVLANKINQWISEKDNDHFIEEKLLLINVKKELTRIINAQ